MEERYNEANYIVALLPVYLTTGFNNYYNKDFDISEFRKNELLLNNKEIDFTVLLTIL